MPGGEGCVAIDRWCAVNFANVRVRYLEVSAQPQLKIGESISFHSHQTEQIFDPRAAPFRSGSKAKCVLRFAVEGAPELLLLVLSWGTWMRGTSVHVYLTLGSTIRNELGSRRLERLFSFFF